MAAASRSLKRTCLFLLLGVCLLLAVAYFVLRPRSEPTYQGITVSGWLQIKNNGKIEIALAKIGTNAIPYLIAGLNEKDTSLEKAIWTIWPKLPLRIQSNLDRFKPAPANVVIENAIAGLRGFPEAAGPTVIEALLTTATNENIRIRGTAISAALELAPEHPEVRALVLAQLQHTNRLQRSWAANCIYSSRARIPEAVPLLMEEIRQFKDGSFNPVYYEISALAVFGPEANVAAPLLASLLSNTNLESYALGALCEMGQLELALPTLREILGTVEPPRRLWRPYAIQMLLKGNPDVEGLIPLLEKALTDGDATVRLLAAVALARITHDSGSTVTVLTRELQNPNVKDSSFVSIRYWIEGPHRFTGIGLDHRQLAAWLLGDCGSNAVEALPLLRQELRVTSLMTPIAARAIYKIEGSTATVLPVLLACLKSPKKHVAYFALHALQEMGPAARPAIPALLELRKRDLSFRRAANLALAKIESTDADTREVQSVLNRE